jgi:hypothetical protein
MVRTTKSIAEKRLGNVPQEKQFWCRDGRVLKSLSELETALRDMSDEVFRHHANESNNDFSNWVRDVFGDEKLSNDLRKSMTQTRAAQSVADRIVWLESRK